MSQWRDRGYGEHPLMRLQRWLSWSLYVGRPLAGVPLRLHWTLLVIPLFEVLRIPGLDLVSGVLVLLLFAAVLNISIYLHEMGHALTALRLGYPVGHIVLYIFGGLVTTYGARNANHDFAIIAFGPMVNLLLVGVASLFHFLLLPTVGLTIANGWYALHPALSPEFFFQLLFWWNLILGVFNLIPIFPLDGAGMLRAALSMKRNPNKVTMQIAWWGQWVIAPVMIAVGLFLISGVAGGFIAVLGILGILGCEHEKQRARHSQIYASQGYGGWETSAGVGSFWDSSDDPTFGAVYGGWAGEKKQGQAVKPERKSGRAERKAEKTQAQEAADRKRVDELLEKISRDGIGALSKREKDFLKNASKRFNTD